MAFRSCHQSSSPGTTCCCLPRTCRKASQTSQTGPGPQNGEDPGVPPPSSCHYLSLCVSHCGNHDSCRIVLPCPEASMIQVVWARAAPPAVHWTDKKLELPFCSWHESQHGRTVLLAALWQLEEILDKETPNTFSLITILETKLVVTMNYLTL